MRKPRHGDIIDTGGPGRRYWLAVYLTKGDILRHRLNVEPVGGLYGISGLWYGRATRISSYGKIIGPITRMRTRVKHRVRGTRPLRKLLR